MKWQAHGIWHEVKPKALSKKDRKHPWIFASYHEAPSEREDRKWYHAFLFRDEDRTLFGIHEVLDALLHNNDVRQMATRVVTDKEFRNSLLSDDPDLPRFWKKRP